MGGDSLAYMGNGPSFGLAPGPSGNQSRKKQKLEVALKKIIPLYASSIAPSGGRINKKKSNSNSDRLSKSITISIGAFTTDQEM